MPTTIQVLKRLRRLAKSWQGDIVEISEEEWTRCVDSGHCNEAPFSNWHVGVCHADKTLVFTQYKMPTNAAVLAATLIHEMGHCFAERELESSNEFNFFGWEQTLALKLGFSLEEWLTANKDYYVTPTRDIGSFQTKRKDGFTKPLYKIIEDRMRVAEALGLVKNGKPQNLRS